VSNKCGDALGTRGGCWGAGGGELLDMDQYPELLLQRRCFRVHASCARMHACTHAQSSR
jgi:hypothetical protein